MANTENIEAKLAAYVDDELDPAARAEIEQYLKSNPQHRQLIEELRSAKSYLQELPRASAPVEVAEMISQQLERAALLGDVDIGSDSGGSSGFSRWPQFSAIAAILLLTVGLAGVLYYVLPSPKPMDPNHVAIVTPDPTPAADDATAMRRETGPSNPGPDRTISDPTDSRELQMRAAGAGASAPGGVGGAVPSPIAVAPAPALRAASDVSRESIAPLAGRLTILVSTSDPMSANTQLINYFASNQISYEHVAMAEALADAAAVEPKLENTSSAQPAHPTTAPEFDNVAGGYIPPTVPTATTNDITKDTAATPATNPAEKLEVAANLPKDTSAPEFMRKQSQQSPPGLFKARMTRDQAAILSETLSQPKLRQTAHVVSPQVMQEQSRVFDQEPQPQQSTPTTNETAQPSTDAVAIAPQRDVPRAPGFANRPSPSRGDVLAPGDTVRIRISEPLRSGTPLNEETQTIDQDGYVELTNVGRVKAAGLTANQLATSVVPLEIERTRDQQSPRFNRVYSIEKIQPEPATQPSSAAPVPDTLPAAAPSEPTTQDTSMSPGQAHVAPAAGDPTTQTTDPAAQLGAAMNEKVDVVVIVQNADAVPGTQPSAEPATAPSEPGLPSTQPTTQPTR